MEASIEQHLAHKITGIEILSRSSRIIKVKKRHEFKAGQVVSLTTDKSIPPRLYSISTGEGENELGILYKTVDSGELTPRLDKLSVGDKLLISPPFGSFLGVRGNAVLIATGTGLAPYLSMIRSGLTENKLLIHGSKTLDDFYYADMLAAELGSKYIRCYTGNGEFEGFFKGRVTKYLENQANLYPDYKYYLCGSAEMVVDVRQILIKKGIPFGNIFSEIYF